jgi:ribose-phosphate pyrophosphokinase
LDRLIVTDTVPPAALAPSLAGRIDVVPIAPLLAEAVARMYRGESLAPLGVP